MSTQTAVTVRRAGPDDAETIHRFVLELATYERAPEKVEATPASFRAQLESARPPFECLIAEDEDGPLGFALFFHNYSTWVGRPGLWIEDIYVPERLRGRGIGGRLFAELGRIANERGCGRVEFSVLDWNEPSIAFYRARGARPLDEWTTFRLEGEALAALAGPKR